MTQSKYSIFNHDQNHAAALASLSPTQKALFGALAFGSIFPLFLVGFVRPVLLPVTLQLACVSALLFMRWRIPAFRGSFLAFLVAVVAFAIASVALVAA